MACGVFLYTYTLGARGLSSAVSGLDHPLYCGPRNSHEPGREKPLAPRLVSI